MSFTKFITVLLGIYLYNPAVFFALMQKLGPDL